MIANSAFGGAWKAIVANPMAFENQHGSVIHFYRKVHGQLSLAMAENPANSVFEPEHIRCDVKLCNGHGEQIMRLLNR
jgi:hypothetical protein